MLQDNRFKHDEMPPRRAIRWPQKHPLFNGVLVSATHYDEVVRDCLDAAEAGRPATIDLMPVSVLDPGCPRCFAPAKAKHV